MSLTHYQQKRNFEKTAEPSGTEKRSAAGSLRFVVQKHDASQVHYDFRLEMDGVLKSWAVPKGPSLNPADKRLAMMVEDHPLDYRTFEGIIPEGAYGGGTVIVWDEGIYEPSGAENQSRKEKEKMLVQQLAAGKISFRLQGQKLSGAFTLFRMKGKGENSWMLVKKKDASSTSTDITQNDRSVKSGRTLAELALAHGTALHHPAADVQQEKKANTVDIDGLDAAATSRKKRQTARLAPATKNLLGAHAASAIKADQPAKQVPMLATLIDEPFDNKDWLFEIKWDGYRAVALCRNKEVELISRNLKPFTQKYRPVAEALSALQVDAVFDGEIVAVDENGMANFQRLQNWQNTPVHLQYYIFDIVWLNGFDVSGIPLLQRKKMVQQIIPAGHPVLKYSDHVRGKGKAFFDAAVQQGLEGIMAKRANSIYQWNTRTHDWAKIKVALRQEVIIAGYTEPRRSRKFFGSLLLGVYKGKKLVYVGHTGSGFDTKTLAQIYNKLQPLKTEKLPFDKKPKTNMPATWVKPVLVCEIKFTEWTREGIARHAIFMGMREDKKPTDVTAEKSTTMATLKPNKKAPAKKATAQKTAAKPATKRSAAKRKTSGLQINVEEETEKILPIDGKEVTITNPQKIYWPKEGFRKGDMINYYLQMAPYILPYLLDRPHSLNRHPNGIDGQNFFQKDVKGKVPAWIKTFEEFSESTGKTVNYLVCTGEADLVYMANLGCIEINPWHARTQDYLKPDWCLIDLDPDKSNSFDEVVDVANLVKQVLDSCGASCCVKTSGSTGMHIYVPLAGKWGFEQSKELAERVVTLVNSELPKNTSLERTPAKRKGKIYLDFLQNKETQTAAAPYSLRPKPGVPVSTPLHWSEVKHGLTPTTWNAYNIAERVKREGDLFAPVLGKGIDLEKVLEKLQTLT